MSIQTESAPNSVAESKPILFFDYSTPYYGGSFRSTFELIEQLMEITNVVVGDAYGTKSQYLSDLEALGIPLHVAIPREGLQIIGGRSRLGRLWRLAREIPEVCRMVRKVRRMVREVGPRVIWTNSEKGMFVLDKAVGGQVPLAVYVLGRKDSILPYCRRAWRRWSMIIGNSDVGLNYLRSSGVTDAQFDMVFTGMDVGRLDREGQRLSAPLPKMDSPLKLAFPASFIPLKNQLMAVRGLGRFVAAGGDAVVWLCGSPTGAEDAPYVEQLKATVAELNLADRVFFLGFRDDMAAVIARCDVVALTSTTEGMPRAVLEGMALGKPVLATDVGGTREAARDGVDGILLAVDDDAGFAEGLRRLADPDVREQMGRSGRQRILDKFSPRKKAEAFLAALDRVAT